MLKTAAQARKAAFERRSRIIAEYDQGALRHIENRLAESVDESLSLGKSRSTAGFEWRDQSRANILKTMLNFVLTMHGYHNIKFDYDFNNQATYVSFEWEEDND